MTWSVCIFLLCWPLPTTFFVVGFGSKPAVPQQRICSKAFSSRRIASPSDETELRNENKVNNRASTHWIETVMAPRVTVPPQLAVSPASSIMVLSPLESWCVENLQEKYNQALSIKCPFFRRRAADMLDAADMMIRKHPTQITPPAGATGVALRGRHYAETHWFIATGIDGSHSS